MIIPAKLAACSAAADGNAAAQPDLLPAAAASGKRCSMCKQTKSIDEFHICRRLPDGRQCRCKQCLGRAVKEARERWAARHGMTYSHAYYLAHREETLARSRQRYRGRRVDAASCKTTTSSSAC